MEEPATSRRLKLSASDLREVRSHGKTPSELRAELQALAEGTAHVRLSRACTPGDGIRRISSVLRSRFIGRYDELGPKLCVSKFVAASGAATRMFRAPSSCLSRKYVTPEAVEAAAREGDEDARQLRKMMRNLGRFAFFDELRSALHRRGLVPDDLLAGGRYGEILEALLTSRGLDYGRLPKALIPFHLYGSGTRTPLEEHFAEAADYLRDRQGAVRIHFTIPPGCLSSVRRHVRAAKKRFGRPGTRYLATLSAQEKWTDTVAGGISGHPARDADGNLLFMQSGHGALLEDLGRIRADLVFIRTIDNVLPERLNRVAVDCRRMLGGLMLELQSRAFEFVEALSCSCRDAAILGSAEEFIVSELCARLPAAYCRAPLPLRARMLLDRLNRPLRVCGIVRLRGKSGGRPFWVRHPDGTESLQIVEGAQVDMRSRGQREIWESTDYFNPADMACGIRDYRGNYFDLREFRDDRAGFVAIKSVAGTQIKVLERPGLWNGGMARWNTVFAEIPAAAVLPVKSILDLLNARHRT